MTIPKHMQFSLAGCHSDNKGIAWEHFGAVWEWATEREWWEGFLEKTKYGDPMFDCRVSEEIINPPKFANTIKDYLEEYEKTS